MVTIKLRYWTKHISCEKPPNSLHSSSSASFHKSSSFNPLKISVFPHFPSSSNLSFIPPPPSPPSLSLMGTGHQTHEKGVRVFLSLRQNDFGTWWSAAQRPRWVRVGSLESLVCALEHEDGVGDFEGGSKLDAHDLHNVGLCQQQEGLPVNHLQIRNRINSCDVTGRGT